MKRRREIILDFTSLLDVIMIILFYFILYSHFEANEAKIGMDKAKADAETAIAQAEEQERKAEELYRKSLEAENKAKRELELLKEQQEQSAYDFSAMQEFESGTNLKIIIVTSTTDWFLKIQKDESEKSTIQKNELSAESIASLLNSMGYSKQSTILCVLSFDGSDRGSKEAYYKVEEVMDKVKEQYTHLYVSKMNLSNYKTED